MARRFVLLFLPLIVLVGGIVAAIYGLQFSAARKILYGDLEHHVALQCEMIAADLRLVISDLFVLAESPLLKKLLDQSPSDWAPLAESFAVFAEKKAIYDQVRYLDASGSEVVRVNFRDGQGVIVPEELLQSKADRYYVDQTMQLGTGDVFVSPFDLNVERGQIEKPIKPTIRFATPVFDVQGRKRGMVVLNYLGEELLSRFRRRAGNVVGHVMLLNRDGFWLEGPDPADCWAFMDPDGGRRSFAARYPQPWQMTRDRLAGQFRTDQGLFTFRTVHPLHSAYLAARADGEKFVPEYYWIVVSHVRPTALSAQWQPIRQGLAQTLLLVGVILAVGTGIGAKVSADHAAARVALERAHQRALQAERLAAIGEAMTGLAHESRNALQRGQACLEMLAKRVRDRADVAQLITRLQSAQDDLYRLYETVREYAAPLVLHREMCDLRELVAASWNQVLASHGDRRARFEQHGDEVDTRCAVDRFSFQQAMRNILDNSLRSQTEQAVHVDVFWSDRASGNGEVLEVVIRDNGPGMSQEESERIFEPFYTTRTRGTGLGMTITRRIIEAHGGQISVGRVAMPGAEIVVHLPRSVV